MTEPKLCTLDQLMAENRQLRAENELLLQALKLSIERTDEMLAQTRKIVTDYLLTRKGPR